MSTVPETAGMHELDKKVISPDEGITDDPQVRVDEPFARQDSRKEAANFSPDPLKRTDRYRLVQPYHLSL